MVLEEASGDMEMYTLPSVIFIDIGREVGKAVVTLPTVDIGVVLGSMVLTVAKGSVVKLVNGCVGVMLEVRNVDFDTSPVEEVMM